MLDANSHSRNVTSLSPYTTYNVTVTATNDANLDNESSHSDVVIVRTSSSSKSLGIRV